MLIVAALSDTGPTPERFGVTVSDEVPTGVAERLIVSLFVNGSAVTPVGRSV